MPAGDDKVADARHSAAPRLGVVAGQLQQQLPLVCVPVPQAAVLADGEAVMRVLDKHEVHDRVRVSEDGAVAIAKVEAPELDVLVGRPAREESAVARDVHAEHRELVAVEREVELEGVEVEYLDGAVQQGHGEQLAVWADPTAEDIVRQLERAGVLAAELLWASTVGLIAKDPLPELNRLISAAAHKTRAVWEGHEAPHGAAVGLLNSLDDARHPHINDLQPPVLGADYGMAVPRRPHAAQPVAGLNGADADPCPGVPNLGGGVGG
mmetsp:Transcript_18892/g.45123  ORF Transcript_18892/g.45123 Transcript_18892/m.45123 type:complete len:266 (-) Transcript_18892:1283-2080(-)